MDAKQHHVLAEELFALAATELQRISESQGRSKPCCRVQALTQGFLMASLQVQIDILARLEQTHEIQRHTPRPS